MNKDSVAGTKDRSRFQTLHPGLSDVRHIVAIASGKGGVGKSTVASNLAVALKATGAKVGLMDADIYGPSQPGMLGAAGRRPEIDGQQMVPVSNHGVKFISMGLLLEGDGPVIWRAPIAMKMIQQFIGSVAWGELDYLLIDLLARAEVEQEHAEHELRTSRRRLAALWGDGEARFGQVPW